MAGFTLTATLATIDPAVATLVVKKWLDSEARRATQEFLQAALPLIPVRTGFLSGSLAGLTRYFATPQPEQLSARVLTVFRRGAQRREYYYPRTGGKILKTPYSGLGLVTRPEQVAQVQADGFTINLQVDIDYYEVNETHWHSIERGTQALLTSLATATERFPGLEPMLTALTLNF